MYRPMLLTMCLALILAGEADDAVWAGRLGTLLGGVGENTVSACAVAPDGTVWIGSNAEPPAGALEVFELPGAGGGCLLRYDAPSGLLLSATRLPGAPIRVRVAADGSVFVAAGSMLALESDGRTLRWSGGPAGRFDLDGAGGVWVAQRDRVVHVAAGGTEAGSFAAGTGWGNEDIAVDPKDGSIFVCGSRSDRGVSNPVHVPWLRAYGADGQRRWTAWDFPGKECDRVGDMADSHPRRLWFGADRRLYLAGDCEGGNTPYRHDPLKAGGEVGKVFDGAAFGETWRAFTSCRMLFVGAFDPAKGSLLRGSFCYGFNNNPASKRLEIGDADVGDLCSDEDGRVFLTGVMRCALPRTANAVHKASAPADGKGRWGNAAAIDECFLVVFGRDLVGVEFASGFNQGALASVASQGKAVGAAGGWVAVGGLARSPSAGPAAASIWLQGAWQSAYAGTSDGYLAVLGPEGKTLRDDPVLRAQAALKRIFPTLAGASNRQDLGVLIGELATSGEQGARAAKVLTRIAAGEIERAKNAVAEDYAPLQVVLSAVATAWVPTAEAAAAAERAKTLAADPGFAISTEIHRQLASFQRAEAVLRPVREAQAETWADRAWQSRNASSLKRLQAIAKDLKKRFPQAQTTALALATCEGLIIPLSEAQEQQAARLARYWSTAGRLALPRKLKEHDAGNGDYRKLNDAVLKELEATLKELREADAKSPYTAAAEEHARTIHLK